jgi:hypothetical protein
MRFEIPVSLKPFSLGSDVPVEDIAFLVLETPGNDEQEITLAYPHPFFYLPFNAAGSGHSVKTADSYMICSEHQIGPPKYLIIPLFWQPNSDYFFRTR